MYEKKSQDNNNKILSASCRKGKIRGKFADKLSEKREGKLREKYNIILHNVYIINQKNIIINNSEK